MKRSLWFAVALAIVILGRSMFPATDVAELEPVEVIRLSVRNNRLCVETDTGQLGFGDKLAEAFADLKASTVGEVFLDTADYLIVTAQTAPLVREMRSYLRPACRVCLESGTADLTAAAKFLNVHEPRLSLVQCGSPDVVFPVLQTKEGRMELVS